MIALFNWIRHGVMERLTIVQSEKFRGGYHEVLEEHCHCFVSRRYSTTQDPNIQNLTSSFQNFKQNSELEICLGRFTLLS